MNEVKLIIGIAGGTGSGKTTIATNIRDALPRGSCTVIDHDAYYRDLKHLPFEERMKVNFDHPESLENELIGRHLAELRAGRTVEKPVYDFTTHTRSSATQTIAPCAVVILEGILVLADEAIRRELDVKLYIDTDSDVRVIRRIRRDMDERGRQFDDIRDQYYHTVRPMHLKFVEPSRRYADLIIPEGGQNKVGLGMVVRSLLRLVEGAPEKSKESRNSDDRS